MPEIRMPIGGSTPPTPSTNEVSLYAKSDKRFYMQDDTGAEVKLLTDEATLAGLSTQLPLTSSGGSNPTLAINTVTTSSNGIMRYQDKLKLDESTEINTPNALVKRDALGNFAANEITASLFKGTATTVSTVPTLSGAITTNGTTNATTLSNGSVSNVHISPSAAISLSKLEKDPLNRANHIGVQDASTLTNFGTVVDSHLNSTAPIVNDMISSTAAIELSKLSVDPLDRNNHTGTQLVSTISDFTSSVEGSIGNYITNNLFTNDNIDAAAGIELSKLAVDPLDRANHTGTQSSDTIESLDLAVFNALEEGNGITLTKNFDTTSISVQGTAGRIDVTSGSIDIDTSYVGQVSITTVGTLTNATWNASTIGIAYGGTGSTNAGAAANNLVEVTTFTSSDTISRSNGIILVDASSGNLVFDLPAASTTAKFTIKKIDSTSNTITVNVEPGDSFEGSTNFVLSTQYEHKTIVSDETTNWFDIT